MSFVLNPILHEDGLGSGEPNLFFTQKGAGQHVAGHSLPSTFTNQTVCQPIGTEAFGEDIFLLVDNNGLVQGRLWPTTSGLPPFHKYTRFTTIVETIKYD